MSIGFDKVREKGHEKPVWDAWTVKNGFLDDDDEVSTDFDLFCDEAEEEEMEIIEEISRLVDPNGALVRTQRTGREDLRKLLILLSLYNAYSGPFALKARVCFCHPHFGSNVCRKNLH